MHYSNVPFTIDEILEGFNKNENRINNNRQNLFPGITHYSSRTWLNRIFPKDIALNPYTMNRKQGDNYLHEALFEYAVKDEDGIYYSMNPTSVVNVLTFFFGFFRDVKTGTVVQVNPSALECLFHIEDLTLDVLVKSTKFTRIINIPNNDHDWFWKQFRYYIYSLLQLHDLGSGVAKYNGLEKKSGSLTDNANFKGQAEYVESIPSKDMRKHWWICGKGKGEDTIHYLKDRQCSPQALVQDLIPLGKVPVLGWDPTLNCALQNKNEKLGRVPTLNEVRKFYKEQEGIDVFTGGTYLKILDYDVNLASDNIQLSDSQKQFHKYCQSYVKNKNKSHWVIPLETFKEGMVRYKVYEYSVVKKRSFVKEIVARDAKSMGYTITQDREWKNIDGEDKRVSLITIAKESYGKKS